MRRRRGQNPLLVKTVAIGVVVTAIILPLLAKFGLFKELHDQYVETQLVSLPPPPPQPKETPPKAKKTVKPHVEAHHGDKLARASRAPTVSVHVAASTGKDDNSTPTIVNTNNTNIGTVPPPTTGTGTGTGTTTAPPPVVTPTPLPVVIPPAPPMVKQDVIVEAEPTYQPNPVIPDDLLDSDLEMTFFAYFTIGMDGKVSVKMVQSTGNAELDQLAMDAAKQWKFTPATKNGVPVLSYRRLQVEFVVS